MGLLFRSTVFIVCSLCFVCVLAIADPTTAPTGTASTDRAEIGLLNRTVDRQQREIDGLKAQVAALSAQLQSLGIAPAAAPPSTQPTVESPARRVIFIQGSYSREGIEEIRRAVNELDATQYFNVLTSYNGKTSLFEPQLVPATDRNKQKLRQNLDPNTIFNVGDWLDALEAAAKWRPDVIWLVGTPLPGDEEKSIREMKKRMAGTSTRINTSLAFGFYGGPEVAHYLSRIAHETGGDCIGKNGDAISEPAIPVKPTPQPSPPEPKSILRTR